MIIVGTAGYSYRDWVGPVYPEGTQDKDMLTHYAQEFSFTEINSSFYRMPNRFMLDNMQKKTPDDFRFAVKVFRGFTHEREGIVELGPVFQEALEPLRETGKLACVLAQFPNSFRNERENRRHLVTLRQVLGDLPVVVEFRHRSWAETEAVFPFLDDLGFGLVCVDAPKLASLFPDILRVTGNIAYVRFHGRNAAKWWKHQEAYERYDYLYSPEELEEWVPKLRSLASQADSVYAVMNNHYQGKAYLNAQQLRALLQG